MSYAGAAVVEKLQAGWRLVMGRGNGSFCFTSGQHGC